MDRISLKKNQAHGFAADISSKTQGHTDKRPDEGRKEGSKEGRNEGRRSRVR
jgi:hypothetical protein